MLSRPGTISHGRDRLPRVYAVALQCRPQCVTGNAACPPGASRLSGRAAMTGAARGVLLLRVLAVLAGDHLLPRTRDALLVLDRVMTDR